jgi:hypothetical protein
MSATVCQGHGRDGMSEDPCPCIASINSVTGTEFGLAGNYGPVGAVLPQLAGWSHRRLAAMLLDGSSRCSPSVPEKSYPRVLEISHPVFL